MSKKSKLVAPVRQIDGPNKYGICLQGTFAGHARCAKKMTVQRDVVSSIPELVRAARDMNNSAIIAACQKSGET